MKRDEKQMNSSVRPNSILVWNSTVHHKCPFEYLVSKGVWDLKMSNLVVNKDMNIVLQPTKQVLLCKDLLGYETNEELFIIGNENVYKTLLAKDEIIRSKNTQDLVTKLVIANKDFYQMSEVEKFVLYWELFLT